MVGLGRLELPRLTLIRGADMIHSPYGEATRATGPVKLVELVGIEPATS
jgi:hypothetical protein